MDKKHKFVVGGAYTTRDGRKARFLGEMDSPIPLVFALRSDDYEVIAYRHYNGKVSRDGQDWIGDILPPVVKSSEYRPVSRTGCLLFLDNYLPLRETDIGVLEFQYEDNVCVNVVFTPKEK